MLVCPIETTAWPDNEQKSFTPHFSDSDRHPEKHHFRKLLTLEQNFPTFSQPWRRISLAHHDSPYPIQTCSENSLPHSHHSASSHTKVSAHRYRYGNIITPDGAASAKSNLKMHQKTCWRDTRLRTWQAITNENLDATRNKSCTSTPETGCDTSSITSTHCMQMATNRP